MTQTMLAIFRALTVMGQKLTYDEVKGAVAALLRVHSEQIAGSTEKSVDHLCIILSGSGGPLHCLEQRLEDNGGRYYFRVTGASLSWSAGEARKQREKVFRKVLLAIACDMGIELPNELVKLRRNSAIGTAVDALDIKVLAPLVPCMSFVPHDAVCACRHSWRMATSSRGCNT